MQRTLLQLAPDWSRRVATVIDEDVREGREDLKIQVPGVLAESLARDAGAEASAGDFGQKAEVGPPRIADRMLVGAHRALVVMLHADERRFVPRGSSWAFGNVVTFVISASRLEGQPAAEWATNAAAHLAREFEIWHATGRTRAEFEAKNMTTPGIYGQPIGIDISRALPGLYWLNYFGLPYVELMDRARLLTAPAYTAEAIGAGVLLRLAKEPWDWNTGQYASRQEAVLEHLGRKYFFSKKTPDAQNKAPDFGLGKLPTNYPRATLVVRGDEVRLLAPERHRPN